MLVGAREDERDKMKRARRRRGQGNGEWDEGWMKKMRGKSEARGRVREGKRGDEKDAGGTERGEGVE